MTEPPIDESAVLWRVNWAPRGMAIWLALVGLLEIFAPDYFFGPTWFRFSNIPHGGFGMGVCCLSLSFVLAVALRRRVRRLIVWVLFLAGVSIWVAAATIVAQGLAGKTGLMEAVFMTYPAADMMIQSLVTRR